MGRIIAGYVRVSTLKQKNDGVSVDMQKEMIIKHALMMELVKEADEIEFFIDDGYSGKSLERPKIKELIEKIKKDEVYAVICYDLSRLSREMFDSNSLLRMFNNHGAALKCIYDQTSIKTASDRFSTNIKILNNQYERERIVERTNDGLLSIAESGRYPCGGIVSFGYFRGEDKNIYIHPADSKIVRRMFKMAKKGYSIDDIRITVNAISNSRNIIFDNAHIRRILKNKIYTGLLHYKGKDYTDIVPRIIEDSLFDEAQRVTRRYSKTGEGYIYNQRLYCKSCGKFFINTHGTSATGQRYNYYKCPECNAIISENKLDTVFAEQEPDASVSKMKAELVNNIEYQLKLLNTRIRTIKNKYLKELINDEDYIELLKPINKAMDRLEDKKREIDRVTINKQRYGDMRSCEEKYKYVRNNVDKIIIEPETKKIYKILMK